MSKQTQATKYSSPLNRQTINKSSKAPEGLPLTEDAASPKGYTSTTIKILESFDSYDFTRICCQSIIDLGIPNPADDWAKGYNDLADKMKSGVVDKEGKVKNKWVTVCNNMQNITTVMTPEMLAVAVCRMAGFSVFLEDVNGQVD